MTTPSVRHHDVVVVGARCAGAPTAMLLARAGHDVALVDRSPFAGDPVSTHSIARGGVVALARWGLLDAVLAGGAPPVREVRFRAPGLDLTRPVKDRCGVDLLVAPRRYALDALLREAAVVAGAHLTTGVTVAGLRRDPAGRVVGITARSAAGEPVEIRARHVVGADGVRSRTANWVGAATVDSFVADTGTFYFYVGEVPWRGHEFHIAPGAFAGVFLTHGGEGCVWLCRPTPALDSVRQAGTGRTRALLDQLAVVAPDLAERARAGVIASPVRGAVGLPNHVRQAAGPGWALVGDAGYHRDPITGHGITDAFRDAELLAAALGHALHDPAAEREAMAAYGDRRDAALRETFDLTREIAAFPPPDRFTELQKQLADALDREAELLASFLIHPAAAAA
jgi:2-polyprenyl-6-methoxyphenol hydroxylase-like FAD-dependent oxidoreductase